MKKRKKGRPRSRKFYSRAGDRGPQNRWFPCGGQRAKLFTHIRSSGKNLYAVLRKRLNGVKVSRKLFYVRKIITALFFSLLIISAATLFINIGMILAARKYVYTDIHTIPPRTAVLVLGSQTRGTRLSPVLQDRVVGGINLIKNRKGKKLLLSGDHGQRYYDEVNAMRLYVLANAPVIQKEDIFMDHAGFSTWDSMYRARDVFEVKDLLIVTQGFHISRAVCMARSLGLDAAGYAVNEERFRGPSLRYWRFREYFARVKAFFFIVFKPKPRYLGDKIPISGDGQATWI